MRNKIVSVPKTRGAKRSWQYLSAVSAMANSSSVKRFFELRGSSQLKTGPVAEAKLLVAAIDCSRRGAAFRANVLKAGRNIVSVVEEVSGDDESRRE